MRIPKSYKFGIALLAIAMVSGHIVQNPRIWGDDAVSKHDDDQVIAPGTIHLAAADFRHAQKFQPAKGLEFELPLAPVASLYPVKALPTLPTLRSTRFHDSGLGNLSIPNSDLNAFGSPCIREQALNQLDAISRNLALDAPCNMDEQLESEHAGLTVPSISVR